MKDPRLFIQEDLLDDTVLRRIGKISSRGEKLPLQEIEYKVEDRKSTRLNSSHRN